MQTYKLGNTFFVFRSITPDSEFYCIWIGVYCILKGDEKVCDKIVASL